MKTSYTLFDRLLHWSMALGILFILLTVFLRLNWMEKNHVAQILTDQLSSIDIEITKEQAIKIAKKIRKPMFDWHLIFGYVVSGIFVLRMFYYAKNKKSFKPVAKREIFELWVYRIFYVLLGITLLTGLYMKFGPEYLEHDIEEIHELSWYYMVVFLVLHFVGILLSELGSKKGLVSKMIGGK